MLPCHSCYIYGTWRSEEVGEFKVIAYTYGGKLKGATKSKFFIGELIPQLFYQNFLPISAYFGVKKMI